MTGPYAPTITPLPHETVQQAVRREAYRIRTRLSILGLLDAVRTMARLPAGGWPETQQAVRDYEGRIGRYDASGRWVVEISARDAIWAMGAPL